MTAIEWLHQWDGAAVTEELRGILGQMLFQREEATKSTSVLSGGEAARLLFCKLMLQKPNVLVLDEPTNHLDLATKEMLVYSLKQFEGTMIFVSHDRTFLRGLASRVLEVGGENGVGGRPLTYSGSYAEYVEKTGHEAPGIHS
jgi:ATPase subunit of ABC transporter with duplicated ATPase domains